MENVWSQAKSAIKNTIPPHIYKMWIDPVDYLDSSGNEIILSCPNYFLQKRILDYYGSMIQKELENKTGTPLKFKLVVSDTPSPFKEKEITTLSIQEMIPRQATLPFLENKLLYGRMLRNDYTFDNFVVGKNSDFAYSAALSLASSKKMHQNSLFLFSNTGMGKSHLAQAVGHHILSDRPMERVYYITAEDFTNEMISSIKNSSIDKFKNKYRTQCDVLLLEDVQFLTGKEKTQVELSITLDYLFEANKKIIFSSSQAPGNIPKLNDQLKSRLSSSLISNISAPGFRTRTRILQKKAKEKGCQIPGLVIEYLASELTENVRQLESGLNGVISKSSILNLPIDINLAESVVVNMVRTNSAITIDTIKKLVCKNYNVTVKDLVSSSRKQSIVRPRQMGMYLSRKYTDQPLNVIGRSFNRYHATAIHAISAVERGIKLKNDLGRQASILTNKLDTGDFEA
ncbi:MAG: chromosomal replication initiator protein DnaA [Proteobacteria bacterium]|nr:chromosomal replication initiator protein DnaA [Pseudomonadota bacterium]